MSQLFCKLQPVLSLQKSLDNFLPEATPPYSTAFTHTSSKSRTSASRRLDNRLSAIKHLPTYSEVRMPTLRPDRTALLVSSTSWTPDEDFTILLEALRIYEGRAREITAKLPEDCANTDGGLPKLLVILTGKGPLREKYMNEVGKLQESWKWVRCISLWLEAGDYPVLLGNSTILQLFDFLTCGVTPYRIRRLRCLHAFQFFRARFTHEGCWYVWVWSSSLRTRFCLVGPFLLCSVLLSRVPGQTYQPFHTSLSELVKNGKNGLLFQTASQLALQLEVCYIPCFTKTLVNFLPWSNSLSFPDALALHSLTLALAELPHGPLNLSNPHILEQCPTTEQDNWTWTTWEENWGRVVRPLVLSDVNL
jgi:beta-1,4-mannosyltransferase